jgi:hypothetical protein
MNSSAVTAIECLDAFVDVSLLVNGVYDVVCAFSILWLPASRLGRLHLHVFKETETPAANRIFAYWVLTYGFDRIIAGAYTSPATDAIAVLSYLMESATHYNESSVFASVDAGKASFVYLASLFLSVVVGIRMALVGGGFKGSVGGCLGGSASSFVQESGSVLAEAHLLSFKSWSGARISVFTISAVGWLISIRFALIGIDAKAVIEISPTTDTMVQPAPSKLVGEENHTGTGHPGGMTTEGAEAAAGLCVERL